MVVTVMKSAVILWVFSTLNFEISTAICSTVFDIVIGT